MSDLSKKFEDLSLEVRSLESENKRLSELLSGYLNERDRLDICTTRIQGTTEACKYSPESAFDTAIRLLETLSKRVAELESSQTPGVKEAWQNFLDVWAIHRSGPSEKTASAMLEAIRRYGNARAFERTGRISELEAVCRQVLDWLPSTDEDLRMQAPRTALANALER
jgi:hypothetical protein